MDLNRFKGMQSTHPLMEQQPQDPLDSLMSEYKNMKIKKKGMTFGEFVDYKLKLENLRIMEEYFEQLIESVEELKLKKESKK